MKTNVVGCRWIEKSLDDYTIIIKIEIFASTYAMVYENPIKACLTVWCTRDTSRCYGGATP